MPKSILFALWAFAAGAGIPIMAAAKGALGQIVGGPRPAALTLFLIGLTSCALVLVLGGGATSLGRLRAAPPYLLIGGVIVAFYILSVTALAPRFGVANTILFVMFAQLISSTLLDQFGAFGAPVRPLTVQRAIGLAIVAAGILVTQFRPLGKA